MDRAQAGPNLAQWGSPLCPPVPQLAPFCAADPGGPEDAEHSHSGAEVPGPEGELPAEGGGRAGP